MKFKATLLSAAALIAAGGFGYSLISSGSATQFVPGQSNKEEIEQIVRDYILENPEIVIEAIDLYSEQEAQRSEARAQENLKTHLSSLLSDEDGYIAGAPAGDAKVVVVEMFDYHCGYCKSATGLINELIEDEKDVRVVFRELPVLREESFYAAEIALAAREQDKYQELHFAMMDASGVLTEDKIDSLARNAGVDVQRLHSTYKKANFDDVMSRTREIAIDLGIDGTPAFIIASIDGSYSRVVPGWAPDAISDAIKEARQSAS